MPGNPAMRFLSATDSRHAGDGLDRREGRLRDRLLADIGVLAGDIGERHLGRPPALDRAAQWVEGRLSEAGLEVAHEPFRVGDHTCRNLIADVGPSRPRLLVGAHYDSVPGCPGADDNATGVAALLALAEALGAHPEPPPIRLAAFANEEPPYFQSPAMGSRVHARACRRGGVALTGAVALDGLGFYGDTPGSQSYPVAPGTDLPDTGDFLALVANEASAELLEGLFAAFREHARLPAQGAILPESAPGTGWSDHWAFWQEGWAGVMVTDTLPFRNPHYHGPTDSPETLDGDRLTRAVNGLIAAIPALARDIP